MKEAAGCRHDWQGGASTKGLALAQRR